MLPRRAHQPDVEIVDLFAQRIAVEAQKLGRLDLIAARRRERRRNQRIFELPQDPMIDAGRRQAIAVGPEQFGQMPLDRDGQGVGALGVFAAFLAAALGAKARQKRRRFSREFGYRSIAR